jgi:hypothetical protein
LREAAREAGMSAPGAALTDGPVAGDVAVLADEH